MYNEDILVLINKIKQKANVDYNVEDFWKDRFDDNIDIAENYATFQTLEKIDMLNETKEDVFKLANDYGLDYHGK